MKRITREEATRSIESEYYPIDTEIGIGNGVPIGSVRHKINELFDYIEYLEANQKD